jgi:hypothetical protein
MNADQIEDRAADALKFLGESDTHLADLETEADALLQKYKDTIDAHFLVLDGSVELRKAAARQKAEPIYGEYLTAFNKARALGYQRKTQMAVVEWCRSLYSNYKQAR